MNTQTEKERLKSIGRGVLEASHMCDDEIEDIVAAPHLFQSIRANIARQQTAEVSSAQYPAKRWSWRLTLAVSAIFAVILSVAVAVIVTTKKQPAPPTAHAINNRPDKVVNTPKPFDDPQPIPVESPSKKIDWPVIQRAAYRVRKHRTAEVEEVSQFYPLTYTDGQDTNVDGGQLVRVELPRSSLVAMGVDPPAENDAQKVKTDLLIGSDGVMKAVRFVK